VKGNSTDEKSSKKGTIQVKEGRKMKQGRTRASDQGKKSGKRRELRGKENPVEYRANSSPGKRNSLEEADWRFTYPGRSGTTWSIRSAKTS